MVFYAPKDFKKGRLVSSKFRWIDIVIIAVAAFISIPLFLFLMTREDLNILFVVLSLVPVIIAFFLIQPFHIYHNFLVFLLMAARYHKRQKTFIWGGIVKYEEKEEY